MTTPVHNFRSINPAKLAAFKDGTGVRIGHCGDSLLFPTQMQVNNGNHQGFHTGIIRQLEFTNPWRGLWTPVGTYLGVNGNHANNMDYNVANKGSRSVGKGGLVNESYLDGARLDWEGQHCLEWKFIDWSVGGGGIYAEFRLANSADTGGIFGIGSSAIADHLTSITNLQLHFYQSRFSSVPYPLKHFGDTLNKSNGTISNSVVGPDIPAGVTEDDLYKVVIPLTAPTLRSVNTTFSVRLRTFGSYTHIPLNSFMISPGAAFVDPARVGPMMFPLLGKGGWSTGHYDQVRGRLPPFEATYTDANIRRKLKGFEFDQAGFNVLIWALGQNLEGGQESPENVVGGSFKSTYMTSLDQFLASANAAGVNFGLIILINTHIFGTGTAAESRATTRGDVIFEVATERGYAFLDMSRYLNPWPSDGFFVPGSDHHLSQIGADHYGTALNAALTDGINNNEYVAPGGAGRSFWKLLLTGGL